MNDDALEEDLAHLSASADAALRLFHMITAGVNAKALSAFMGRSSIEEPFDLYGHLMPGTEAEAASLLDTYLSAAVVEGGQTARAAIA